MGYLDMGRRKRWVKVGFEVELWMELGAEEVVEEGGERR